MLKNYNECIDKYVKFSNFHKLTRIGEKKVFKLWTNVKIFLVYLCIENVYSVEKFISVIFQSPLKFLLNHGKALLLQQLQESEANFYDLSLLRWNVSKACINFYKRLNLNLSFWLIRWRLTWVLVRDIKFNKLRRCVQQF